jgi:hypothetical protein
VVKLSERSELSAPPHEVAGVQSYAQSYAFRRDFGRYNDKFRVSICVDQRESFLTPRGVTLSGGALTSLRSLSLTTFPTYEVTLLELSVLK